MMNGNNAQMREFEKNQKQCPNGCEGAPVMGACPPKGVLKNAWQRCARCASYWETTPDGRVTNRRIPLFIDVGDKTFEEAKADIARQIEELQKQQQK